MTTKLNLTIEEKTAKQIKTYARKRKVSVSKIAEEYFNSLIKKSQSNKKERSFVEKWGGIIKGGLENIDKVKSDYLKEKYGL
jgi:hypothetical protein